MRICHRVYFDQRTCADVWDTTAMGVVGQVSRDSENIEVWAKYSTSCAAAVFERMRVIAGEML